MSGCCSVWSSSSTSPRGGVVRLGDQHRVPSRGLPGYDTRLTQGGDEWDLLRRLRTRGRVVFDLRNRTLTSSRRLQRGLAYNVVVSCLYYYVLGYLLNRATGRTVLGMAPAIRPSPAPGPSPVPGPSPAPRSRRGGRAENAGGTGPVRRRGGPAAEWAELSDGLPRARLTPAAGVRAGGCRCGRLLDDDVIPQPAAGPVPVCRGHRREGGGADVRRRTQRAYTGAVADLLGARGIRATFFQVGACVQRWPASTARLAADGHVSATTAGPTGSIRCLRSVSCEMRSVGLRTSSRRHGFPANALPATVAAAHSPAC